MSQLLNPDSNWWADFFHGPVLDVVRAMMPPEATASECDFIWKHLALNPGAAVLDVPCGAGRHALELARRGWRVTGVDLSPELVADAARSAAYGRIDASFVVADMRELPGPAAFDGAYCFGNSFAYLDDAGNAAFLAAVRRVLRPGGKFLLETRLCAESVLTAPRARSWHQFGDTVMLHESRYEPAAGRLVSEYGFFVDGKLERRAAGYRVYLYRELMSMFVEAGLTVESTFGGVGGEPFALGSGALYVAARAG